MPQFNQSKISPQTANKYSLGTASKYGADVDNEYVKLLNKLANKGLNVGKSINSRSRTLLGESLYQIRDSSEFQEGSNGTKIVTKIDFDVIDDKGKIVDPNTKLAFLKAVNRKIDENSSAITKKSVVEPLLNGISKVANFIDRNTYGFGKIVTVPVLKPFELINEFSKFINNQSKNLPDITASDVEKFTKGGTKKQDIGFKSPRSDLSSDSQSKTTDKGFLTVKNLFKSETVQQKTKAIKKEFSMVDGLEVINEDDYKKNKGNYYSPKVNNSISQLYLEISEKSKGNGQVGFLKLDGKDPFNHEITRSSLNSGKLRKDVDGKTISVEGFEIKDSPEGDKKNSSSLQQASTLSRFGFFEPQSYSQSRASTDSPQRGLQSRAGSLISQNPSQSRASTARPQPDSLSRASTASPQPSSQSRASSLTSRHRSRSSTWVDTSRIGSRGNIGGNTLGSQR
jgi:hypothetical protein